MDFFDFLMDPAKHRAIQNYLNAESTRATLSLFGSEGMNHRLPQYDPRIGSMVGNFTSEQLGNLDKNPSANASSTALELIWPWLYAAMMNDPGTRATFGGGAPS